MLRPFFPSTLAWPCGWSTLPSGKFLSRMVSFRTGLVSKAEQPSHSLHRTCSGVQAWQHNNSMQTVPTPHRSWLSSDQTSSTVKAVALKLKCTQTSRPHHPASDPAGPVGPENLHLQQVPSRGPRTPRGGRESWGPSASS